MVLIRTVITILALALVARAQGIASDTEDLEEISTKQKREAICNGSYLEWKSTNMNDETCMTLEDIKHPLKRQTKNILLHRISRMAYTTEQDLNQILDYSVVITLNIEDNESYLKRSLQRNMLSREDIVDFLTIMVLSRKVITILALALVVGAKESIWDPE
ncbi:uncharacterized protein LOC105702805 isoform X2 [Orussus abietinus]|uniref:uncharacterized protein LOC105702805 isoform X2 n=1 Tax=Orussus abietinus TaxID=222816 RepID=UPI000625BBB7|nr:uncharacterized protein LOC105702805 isoform X2 [Orussus abietinus]